MFERHRSAAAAIDRPPLRAREIPLSLSLPPSLPPFHPPSHSLSPLSPLFPGSETGQERLLCGEGRCVRVVAALEIRGCGSRKLGANARSARREGRESEGSGGEERARRASGARRWRERAEEEEEPLEREEIS